MYPRHLLRLVIMTSEAFLSAAPCIASQVCPPERALRPVRASACIARSGRRARDAKRK